MSAIQSSVFKRIIALRVDQPSIFSVDRSGGDYQVVVGGLDGVPDGVQVDGARGIVYWTNMGADFDADTGTVESATLSGADRRLLAGQGAFTSPKQLHLEADHQLLYWCDREGAAVLRSKTDGSGLIRLVDRSEEPGGKRELLNQCVGIAVDRAHQRILWTQKGPSKGGQGRIFSAGLEIPTGETASTRSDIQILLKDLPEPIDLAVDAEKALLYWTDRGAPPCGNSLNRARLTPNGLADPEVICTGFEEAIGLTVDSAGNLAYVADLAGQIWCVDLGTGRSEVICQHGKLTGIALY